MTIRASEEMRMRGTHSEQSSMFSYISAERRVPKDHPLRAIRAMADMALKALDQRFAGMYAVLGRPSIAPERLLRALLLQVLYTVRSERMLMEQLDYNFLFRWFVGLSIDDPVWDVTVFTKNRERRLKGEVAQGFFHAVVEQARAQGLLSDEHFTVDGTLIEAWAGHKSFKRNHRSPHRARLGCCIAHTLQQAEPHNWRKTFAPRIVALTCAAHVPLLALALAAELVEQCLCILQIGGVEALGEPAVDVGEHRARLATAPLL